LEQRHGGSLALLQGTPGSHLEHRPFFYGPFILQERDPGKTAFQNSFLISVSPDFI
jgi:hypothetical protein